MTLRAHLAVPLALAVVGLFTVACSGPTPRVAAVQGKSHPARSYVIPAGTTTRIEAGDAVDVLPARLRLRVGQVIRIVNDDTSGQIVGPFYIAAHSTMTERFTSAGRFTGKCSVHLSGQIVLDVSP